MKRALAVLATAACVLGPAAPAPADPDRSGLERHRELMREFQRISAAGPEAALAFARAEVDKAGRLAPDDPRRGDALELLALAYLVREEFPRVLPPATEVVRIRKAARPVNQELLGLALGTQATALFALGRSEEADGVLREHLAAWRRAFGPRDLRLAQKLELHAEYVEKGFGRPRQVIALLAEAVKIRDANPTASAGKLAGTLQELAIHRLRMLEYADADAELARAETLLRTEMSRDPDREENRAGLAQVLVLRAGIAGALARRPEALALVDAAQRLRFEDRVLRAEHEILVAAALGSVLANLGDVAGAIAKQNAVLEAYGRYDDLIADGSLDREAIGDTLAQIGSLYLEQDELGRAREALTAARQRIGDTSALLFQLSELERKTGNVTEALSLYRDALRLRKESASEVAVMFGTNRRLEPGAEGARFGGELADLVSVGGAVVLVPGGPFSTRTWLTPTSPVPLGIGRATDPEQLVIRSKSVMSSADFLADARAAVSRARLYPGSALVFVHGYNVTFDAAVQRGAQLVRDLNYDSAAFVFSWPSKGDWWRYGTDRASADRAVTSLVEFLGRVQGATGAEKIHIIAHSMGNRVLLPALARVASDPASTVYPRLGEVILAAPAVPQREFIGWIDALGRRGFQRLTLYASAVDKAMRVGFLREGGSVLAGYVANGRPLLRPNIQSIDVSEAGAGGIANLNHDVFASNPVMTEDMRQLLQSGRRPPHARLPTLQQRSTTAPAGLYWYYRLPSPRLDASGSKIP
jgi:esterase/lipase superfamily enzyme